MKVLAEKKLRNRSVYMAVISVAALAASGRTALAQTNVLANSESSTNVTDLGNVTVVGKLNQARNQIVPDLGATAYTINKDQIASGSQGGNAPFSEIILRAPGVAQDSAANGDLHVRGEHANLQYRINDVLLPEGISGFGLELDPRFVESMQLITGSLPAQYGFRTAGVVDIQTKSGAFAEGGQVEMYGGSYDTVRPSFEYGGSAGKWNYYIDGSYDHNALGIENPTASHSAIHDDTDQYKTFVYASRVLDDTSRISLIGSASYSSFEIPNTPGLTAGTQPDGNPWVGGNFDSSQLNERQKEQNYYGAATYQKSAGDLNVQVSGIGRDSGVHFLPDEAGDLYFDGAASDVKRDLVSGGLQVDASYALGEKHTIRVGTMFLDEFVAADSTTTVFPTDSNGNRTGQPAESIVDNNNLDAQFYGLYLQDEWKIFSRLTLNYGARFDVFNSSFDNENQLSPRVNLIYQPTDKTTLHAGYSRYFTPPPVEDVSGATLAKFSGTSNDAGTLDDNPVKAERANYFDAGITQKLAPGLQVGVDGYYKEARNQLDDGLFGQTLILSAFNYAKGRIYGTEFTANYDHGGFSSYANVALSVAQGEDWNSAEFLFGPAGPGTDRNYVQNHWIYLDHDQRITGSFGTAYTWKESAHRSTRVYADALYGSGLRTDATDASGNNIPNGGSVPAYYSINLGVEQRWKLGVNEQLKARLDVVNVTDNSYELRDGSGVGVNAAQYGMRRGLFGSISLVF